MCGIAGFVRTHPDPNAIDRLETMADVLAHRGPDGRGFFVSADGSWPLDIGSREPRNPTEPWTIHRPRRTRRLIALANVRLAIIDLVRGRQPVFSEDRSVVVVFNGEIYNYQALRSELLARGHTLASATDSEVLPHLYEEHGVDGMLERLDGMFAFALWDEVRARLVLARDRLGEKPLYYRVDDHGILFASELKGLLVHPDVPRHMDLASVAEYLLLEAVPAPATIYEGMAQLEPAAHLVWEADGTRDPRPKKYWTFPDPYTIRQDRTRRTNSEWLEELEQVLTTTIASRLTGDVPIGVLLSGGLDSSLIASVAREHLQDLPTFSVGFREASFDESAAALEVARTLGTRHHHLLVGMADIGPILSRIQLWLDEPLADGSLIPTAALTAWVRRHDVTVVLSGDGGDEAFGGYPTYLAHRLDPVWDRVPPRLARALARAARRLPASYDNISPDFVVKRTLAGLEHRGALRHAVWMGGLSPEDLARVLHVDVRRALERGEGRAVGRWQVESDSEQYDWPENIQLLDLRHYLPNDLLVKVDRAAMSVGLEVRAPFVSHRVIELGLRLPSRLKLSGARTKVAIRALCEKRLPPSITGRPKKGFGMPTAHWLRDMNQEVVDDWLAPPADGRPLFHQRLVADWLAEHRAGRADHRKRLWPIVMLERWRRGPWGPDGA